MIKKSSFDLKELEKALPTSNKPLSNYQYLIFWDLETVPSYEDQSIIHIVEYGGIVVDSTNMRIMGTHQFYIKPPSWITSSSTLPTKNTFFLRNIEHAKSFIEYAEIIYKIMDGHTWIGHNISNFDIPVLIKEYDRIGQNPPLPTRIIDTYRLFQTWRYKELYTENLKLETLMDYFGQGKQTHEALDDAKGVYNVLCQAAASRIIGSMIKDEGASVVILDRDENSLTRLKSISQQSPIYSSPSQYTSPSKSLSSEKTIKFEIYKVNDDWIKNKIRTNRVTSESKAPEYAWSGTPENIWEAFNQTIKENENGQNCFVHGAYQFGEKMIEVVIKPEQLRNNLVDGYNQLYEKDKKKSYSLSKFKWVRIVKLIITK